MKTVGLPISHKENEKRRTLVPNDIQYIKHPEKIFIEDGYGELFVPSKSHYKPNEKNVTLRCTNWLGFTATLEDTYIPFNGTITVSEDRAEELLSFRDCFEVVKETKTRDVKNLSK